VTLRRLQIVEFVLLQCGWFAAVLGGAAGREWLGPIVVTAALAVHLTLSPAPRRDLRTIVPIALLGVATDGIQVAAGVLSFPEAELAVGPLPLWIVALWPLFGANFHSTLAWLRERPRFAALLGAVGGPPGYVAADRLGALELSQPLGVALPALAAAWAVALPVGVLVARRNDPVGATA